MSYEFVLPSLAADTEEGVVVAWFKRDGSEVREGERLLEVQLAKVSYEVPAPISGTLHRILAPKDAIVRVGQPLAVILRPGEAAPAESPAPPREAAAVAPAASEAFVPATPVARRIAREQDIDLARLTGTGDGGRITEQDVQQALAARAQPGEVRASPLARRLAQEHGLDLAQVRGTGAGGRIGEDDVRAAIAARGTAPTRVPLTPMRRTIARRMSESIHSMAQLTLISDADVTALVAARQSLKAQFDVTYTDLIVKACALALKAHPALNARWSEDAIELMSEINIGVAVALEDGLIVPVVRNADRKSLAEIAGEMKQLAQRARDGSLTGAELAAGTFSVTNLGTYGVDAFTPIVDPPEAAILGVGRIVEKPARLNGELAWRSMLTLSLTVDHRVVDGAPAAVFLQTLREHLEQPVLYR